MARMKRAFSSCILFWILPCCLMGLTSCGEGNGASLAEQKRSMITGTVKDYLKDGWHDSLDGGDAAGDLLTLEVDSPERLKGMELKVLDDSRYFAQKMLLVKGMRLKLVLEPGMTVSRHDSELFVGAFSEIILLGDASQR